MHLHKPKAVTKCGVIELGSNCALEAYVLDDGRRVLKQSDILAVLTAGPEASVGSKDINKLVSRIPDRGLTLAAIPTVEFTTVEGKHAVGREARFLVDVCCALQSAYLDGLLHPSQERVATQAMRLLSALAGVGIDALVDDATGYVAGDGDLEGRLNKFLLHEAGQWSRLWTKTSIAALSKVFGISWDGGRTPSQLAGHFHRIYRIVLGDEIVDALKSRNPKPHMMCNMHQFLKEDARALLASDVRIIEVLAIQSQNEEEFYARLKLQYRSEALPAQLSMLPPSKQMTG